MSDASQAEFAALYNMHLTLQDVFRDVTREDLLLLLPRAMDPADDPSFRVSPLGRAPPDELPDAAPALTLGRSRGASQAAAAGGGGGDASARTPAASLAAVFEEVLQPLTVNISKTI